MIGASDASSTATEGPATPVTTAAAVPTGALIQGDSEDHADLAAHPSVVALRGRFAAAVREVTRDALGYPVVWVDPGEIADVLRFLREDADQAYDLLADVMGAHAGVGAPIQVWYQLWSMSHGRQLRVACEVPLDHLELDTVTDQWRTADWLERERRDGPFFLALLLRTKVI